MRSTTTITTTTTTTRTDVRRLLAAAALGAVVTSFVIVAAWAAATWRPFQAAPSTWDPLVAPIARFVEAELGTPFDRPVRVVFQDEADFVGETTTDPDLLDDDERLGLADDEAIGRALGLLSGETDLLADLNAITQDSLVAYYSWAERHVVIRTPEGGFGDELPVDVRVTVAHELAHVWQDQHHGIGALYERAEAPQQEAALNMLLEGHATWVENQYLERALSRSERAVYDRLLEESFEPGNEDAAIWGTAGSSVLEALSAAPYLLGPEFVAALTAHDADLLNGVFEALPLAEDQIMRPWAYLSGDTPATLDPPDATGEVVDESQLGAVAVYLMLVVALPAPEALAAADAWGNDWYVAERVEGVLCVTMHVVGDDPPATEALADAFDRWASQRVPAAQATANRSGGHVVARACDPGSDADQPMPDDEAIFQLFGRSADLVFVLEETDGVEQAQCTVDGLYHEFAWDDIVSDDPLTGMRVWGRVEDLLEECA